MCMVVAYSSRDSTKKRTAKRRGLQCIDGLLVVCCGSVHQSQQGTYFDLRNVNVLIGFHKSTLVARGANTQLKPSCVSAPLATNVDLFVCFAEYILN